LRDVRRQISKVAKISKVTGGDMPARRNSTDISGATIPAMALHGDHAISTFTFRAVEPLIGDTQNESSVSPSHPNSDTPMLTVILIGGGIPTSNVSSRWPIEDARRPRKPHRAIRNRTRNPRQAHRRKCARGCASGLQQTFCFSHGTEPWTPQHRQALDNLEIPGPSELFSDSIDFEPGDRWTFFQRSFHCRERGRACWGFYNAVSGESVRMAIEKLRDESILRFYDAIRREVEADRSYKRKFMIGTSVRQYAEALRVEMTRR
jgi:hypothetical protein